MEAKSMKSFSIHMAAYALAAAVLVTGCGKKSEDVAKQKPARPTQLDAPPHLTLPDIPAAGETCVLSAWSALTNAAAVKAAITTGESTWPAEFLAPGAVKLPVDFTAAPAARASWDVKLPCDLRAHPAIEFDFVCGDLTQFTSFSCYLRSGNGWYSASFAPEEDKVWTHVRIPKGQFRTEGVVEGWEKISTMRISGWRAGTNSTVCAIANVATSGRKPDVAIVYAESLAAKGGGEAKGYMTFAANMAATLEALGVGATIIADTDLTPELLAPMKAVALPYNPSVPSNALSSVRGFVLGGRKVLACYSLPKEVADLLGVELKGTVRPEDRGESPIAGFLREGKGLAGQPEFSPQQSWITSVVRPLPGATTVAMWGDGKKKPLKHPALVRASTGVYMAHVWIGGTSGAQAQLMRAIVGELAPELGERIAAREKAREERRLAIRAWLADCPSKAGEHRAFWCHSARGLGGDHNWDTSISFLKKTGFNAILPNLCWGGVAFYDSQVLPVSPDVATRGDALKACLAACRKYGVKCHVWKVCWNMGSYTSQAFADRMAATNRVQVGRDGAVKGRWLCPSNPDNQQLEIDAMCELARKGVDGIHFDYIRYPDLNHCFCAGCRTRFEAFAGVSLTNWPAQVRADEALKLKWAEFRASNITKVVKTVAERVRAESPGVQISAAVFRNPATDADTVGQDWSRWCREGWLDFVCPMDYVDSAAMFKSQARMQKEAVGKAKLYPGIGLSCWTNDGEDAVRLAKQIQAVRDLGLGGFTVFNFDRRAEGVLPLMRLGVTKED